MHSNLALPSVLTLPGEMPRQPSHATASPTTRRRLLIGASALLAFPETLASASTQASDALQNWLAAAALPIRSVDAADENFADLEPLARAIGNASIVQLGEPSHGAGTAFAAKVRLIKFLHQRMGFDVVAWESGFYDVAQDPALRSKADPMAAAQRSILQIWSASEQCRPLFDYARASQAGARPLTMAGVDMQFTGPAGFDDFPSGFRSFVDDVRDDVLRRTATQSAEALIDAFGALSGYTKARAAFARALERTGVTGGAIGEALATWERSTGARLRPDRGARDRIRVAVDRLRILIERHRAAWNRDMGERRCSFFERAIASIGGYGEMLYESDSPDIPPGTDFSPMRDNRRDSLMAENLRWLVEHGYPGRKIIVWAHNAHVMNAYYRAPEFRQIALDPVPNTMKPMGVWLKQWFGERVYTIGCTAYGGTDGWVGSSGAAFAPAAAGGIEDRLHRLGYEYALLDLRAARRVRGHPLSHPRTMRVPKYDDVEIPHPTQPFDALFYIARMQPATRALQPT